MPCANAPFIGILIEMEERKAELEQMLMERVGKTSEDLYLSISLEESPELDFFWRYGIFFRGESYGYLPKTEEEWMEIVSALLELDVPVIEKEPFDPSEWEIDLSQWDFDAPELKAVPVLTPEKRMELEQLVLDCLGDPADKLMLLYMGFGDPLSLGSYFIALRKGRVDINYEYRDTSAAIAALWDLGVPRDFSAKDFVRGSWLKKFMHWLRRKMGLGRKKK